MSNLYRPGTKKQWFDLSQAESGGPADIYLYDDIGMWGTTARDFVESLLAANATSLNIYINSAGGDVAEGLAIYNALKRHEAKKTIYIDGIAHSIASVIAMAGDEIVMPETAMMFVHKPWAITAGNSDDLSRTASQLDAWETAIIAAYAAKTGMGTADIAAMLKDEKLLSSAEAIELGFADKSTTNDAPVQMSYRGAVMARVFAKFKGVNSMTDEKPEIEVAEEPVAIAEVEPVSEPVDEHPEPVEAEPAAEPAVDARAEFKTFVDRFGSDRAARYFAEGLSFDDAQVAYLREIEAENAELKAKAQGSSVKPAPIKPTSSTGEPMNFSEAVAKCGGGDEGYILARSKYPDLFKQQFTNK
jgi:ATP-dependent protease ClpP protease subunit